MRKRERRAVRYGPAFSLDAVCPDCGVSYRDFRTGMSYREVWAQFWKHSDDRTAWRNKRRHTVLGRWHEIKLGLWEQHRATCGLVDVPF